VARHNEHDLIASLYDAALGHRSWDEVGPALVKELGGLTLMMSVHHPDSAFVEVVATLGMTPQDLADYATHYARYDLWTEGALKKRLIGRALLGSEIVEDRVLQGSLIYNEFLRPKLNMHHLAGAILPMDDGCHVVLGIHRPPDAPAYSTTDASRLNRLLPHLQRALEVRQRLRATDAIASSLVAAFDRLSSGVVLLSSSGRVVHCNSAADKILHRADGLRRSPSGIHAAHVDEDQQLQALIARAKDVALHASDMPSAGGHVRISRPSGLPPHAVLVSPVGNRIVAGTSQSTAIALFVSDPALDLSVDPAVLERLFTFTTAESAVVLALVSGTRLLDFAKGTHRSYSTVRTLLARAMARTETHSQVELLRLVLSAIGPARSPCEIDASRGMLQPGR
jgi:DNA-binding CsgD family transcriptional regulator/PAS domain-containing protein